MGNKQKYLINAKEISFAYDKELIIKNANFSVNTGDFITIVGPNGGGKTTLINLLMGRLKPQKGKITIKNNNTKIFGYVPQYTTMDASYPITLMEVVLTGKIKPMGFYKEKDKKAALNTIKSVGLEEHTNTSFFKFSGGQKQRGLIARALVSSPEILILDEPTANIDAESEQQLNNILKTISLNKTILIITHDLAFVNELSTRVLCVNKTVKEHPLETLENGTISTYYTSKVKIVKHEKNLLQGTNT